jgi:signal recognition particle GTPase
MPQPQSQSQPQEQTQQLLEKISKIVIKQPNNSVINAVKEETSDTIEVTFKAPISENDFTMYTNIIKNFWPEPSDTPEVFGKFKVIKDGNEYKIVSEKPLTLLEYFQLLNNDADFEGYIEDKLVLVNPATINKILDEAHRIRYYSNKKLQVTFNYSNSGYGSSCSVTELIEIELEDTYSPNKENTLVNATIRAYVKVWRKGYTSYESLLRRMIEKLYNADISVNNLDTLVEFIKQEIRFRKHNLSPSIEVTLRSGNFEKIEKIMDVLGKEFKLDVKDIDAIKSKGAMKIYYNEYYGTLEVRPL